MVMGTSTVSTGKNWEHWVWNGTLTGDNPDETIKVLEAKWKQEWTKYSSSDPIILERDCTISLNGKELKMKVVCKSAEEVFGKPAVDETKQLDKKIMTQRDYFLSILREEMESCKQAGKMAEACVLLKVIKKIENPLSWLNDTLGS